jgi:hypothetical protein
MNSKQLRRRHFEVFNKLNLSERLAWAFSQYQFLAGFISPKEKLMSRVLRRNGKKYFKKSNLGQGFSGAQ